MTAPTDQALLELVQEGDERAFEALVLRYRRPLRSYCIRLGVPAHGTEDVVQQALLEAWLALSGGARVQAFKAWLFRIVHNIALDAIRETPRVVALATDEAEQAASTRPGTYEPGLHEALTAVAALPLLQREAIVRTALAGESHEQVGRYLGLTAGAVRGLIYRGRTTLRSALAALVPPWLPRLIAGRSSSSGGLRESLSGLASSAGSTGSAGALVKAGAIVAVAATAITTTLPAHATHSATHGPPRRAPANPAVLGSRLAHESPAGDARTGARASSRSALATRSSAPAGMPHASSGPAPLTDSTGGGQGQQQASKQATGTQSESTVEASTAGTASSQPAGTASSTPTEAPSGSGTPPTGGSGPPGSGQTLPTSGSSGSSSSEGGGPVGGLVHTVEKTLETTVEDTLGGLLHH
jgi:RNA polymerase sigma-70 factor (ECF subfamily)